MLDKFGSGWAEKPVNYHTSHITYNGFTSVYFQNDYLTWTIEEEASGHLSRDLDYLAVCILHVNFAAIHTTSLVSLISLPYSNTTVKLHL
jgi:hypothetical protein